MENIIRLIKKGHPREIKRYLEEKEKYLSPVALVFGFILDNLTLTRVDLLFDNLILLSYILIAGISILLLNAYEAERISGRIEKIIPWLPLAMQFAFGGLFSGFVVLYSRSSSLSASWPFIITLLVLLVGNEFLKRKYEKLFFQLSIYFVAIFSYLIFAIPVILDSMGALVFILSGVTSLLCITIVVRLIFSIAPWKIYFNQKTIIGAIFGIYALFNILYFTNIIPPIPLASRDIVIAHSVKLMGTKGVEIKYEPAPWYQFFKDFNGTYHRVGSEPVYVYSSIYAPTNLSTEVVHEWSYFDEKQGRWIVTDKILYSIFGGRNEGYRGFSVKTHITPGKWKVAVKTKRGQVLGQTKINVVQVDSLPETRAEVR